MAYFPFFVELSEMKGLVVGGGRVACRKVRKLLEADAALRVVAREPSAGIDDWAREGRIELVEKEFEESDLDEGEFDFVVAATGVEDVDRRVAALAKARRILVNAVDEPDASSFVFPATIRRGSLVVAVSTSGASPALAAELRDRIEQELPKDVETTLERLKEARAEIKRRVGDPQARKRALREAFLSVRRGVDTDDCEAHGRVDLIGAGAGDASLITLRGRDALRRCDVALYDELVDRALLEYAPKDALKISVGKRSGRASPRQEEINALMIEYARQGLRVARLKGGDPCVFGRGGEEALALRAAGIEYELVPGVTSAFCIPLEAGIPATHRGASRGACVVSARTSDAEGIAEIEKLANFDGTLIFLMGLGALEKIAERLIAAGKSAETPAAVVSGGASGATRAVRASLKDVAAKTRAVAFEPPAVVVVGATAALDIRGKRS